MKKIAIFVEGQTELIFVRQMLLTVFEYGIDLQCRTLVKDGNFQKAEYDFTNADADLHFQIINVQNDNAVLSRMLKREKTMTEAGYAYFFCLRDMYSENYQRFSKAIDEKINQNFIQGAQETILRESVNPDRVSFHFAIMEVEAWFLSLYQILERIDSRLTPAFIQEKLGIDLSKVDPEKEIFHPAAELYHIHKLVGLPYKKKKEEIEAIANQITKAEYEHLNRIDKAASFSGFYEKVLAVAFE